MFTGIGTHIGRGRQKRNRSLTLSFLLRKFKTATSVPLNLPRISVIPGYSAEVTSVSNLRVGVIEIHLVNDVEETGFEPNCLLSVIGVDL